MRRRSCSGERNVPETNLAHLGPAIRWRCHASTPARPEPTCFTDIVWQANKSTPGTCIPESRAYLSRQSSLERKASATDKCPASLRTASHFLCPGNGTLFYSKKRYVRYGPLSCLRRFQSGRRTKALDVSPRAGHQMGHGEKQAFLHAQTAKDHDKISLKCILRRARTAKGPLSGKIFAKCIPQHCFSLLFAA